MEKGLKEIDPGHFFQSLNMTCPFCKEELRFLNRKGTMIGCQKAHCNPMFLAIPPIKMMFFVEVYGDSGEKIHMDVSINFKKSLTSIGLAAPSKTKPIEIHQTFDITIKDDLARLKKLVERVANSLLFD